MAVKLPIDAIGFILVPDRRRTVSLDEVVEMLEHIPSHIASVAVMQNPTFEEVIRVYETGVSMIQLHGQESPDFCKQIRDRFDLPIIKVFAEDNFATIPFFQGTIDIALLDHAGGGAGIPIDWTLIPQAKKLANQIDVPLWVAGGIKDDNISELYNNYEIDGIDLSSGIEVDGIKDQSKMRAIIERMEQCAKVK